MARVLLFLVLLTFSFSTIAQQGRPGAITPHVSPALRFTENNGQWDNRVLFRATLNGGALFVERNCLTFNFYDKQKLRKLHGVKRGIIKDLGIKSHAYKMHFRGSNISPVVEKEQQGSDYENFFQGNDQQKWRGNVRNYHQVFLRNLYNGIDYEIITATNGIKYNFHIRAGVDPSLIRMEYEGVESAEIVNDAVILKLSFNEVVEQKPYAYQLVNGQVQKVKCRYKLQGNHLAFDFPEGYDKKFGLVIDPLLVFAAQSGSTADNFGMTATFDAQGNLYAGGTVYDNGYPTTTGAYSSSFQGTVYYGITDVVVSKYNSTGTNLLYSTYIGGQNCETVHSMIVDANNNLCIYGVTGSSDFPTTTGCYDNSFNGGSFLMFVSNGMRFNFGTDIYITKFNSSGTALLGSTFIGGSGNDGLNHSDQYNFAGTFPATPPASGNISVYEPHYDSLQYNYGDQCRGEIQLDAFNNIYIASSTRSSNFPMVNGFDNTMGGRQDAVIAKLNSALTSLLYSSFVGGSSTDAGFGLIVMPNREVYMTGGTSSSNFPYCSAGYQNAYQGGIADGYVIRIHPTGTVVTSGTFFGTSVYDQSFFVQSDKYSNIYIYGQSHGNIPVLKAFNAATVFSVSGTHQFISRFNNTLSALNLSTVFGSHQSEMDISPSAFSVDKCNNIYISGWGGNIINSFPVLANMPMALPTQSVTDGFDFYFMGLDSNAAALKYGSYFGGGTSHEHVDGGTSRFDPQGRIYQSVCAGCGGNDDFPVTSGSWPGTPGNSNHSSNCNNGVIKLDFQLQLAIATIKTNTLSGCLPMVVSFTNATAPTGTNASFTWYLGNGVVTSTSLTPTVTYTNPGTYSVALVVRDPVTCNKQDSTITYVTVFPKPSATISLVSTPCTNTIQVSNVTTGTLGSNPFAWSPGTGSTIFTVSSFNYTYVANGNYNVTFTVTDVNGCNDVKTAPVTIFTFSPAALTNTNILCSGSSATFNASGGTSYLWSPPGTLNNASIASPVATPASKTIYTVDIFNNSAGFT
jgi:PKD repeat protein